MIGSSKKPAGSPEDLKKALTLLIGSDPNMVAEFESEAAEQIQQIAIDLLENLESEAEEYRQSAALVDLRKIEDLAKQLGNALERLDLLVLGRLNVNYGNYDGDLWDWPKYLAACARTTSTSIEEDCGPDRGGRTTLFSALHGTVRRNFVASCAMSAIVHFDISATAGGRFHEFVCTVWQYATGEDGEVTGILNQVKELAPLVRKWRAAHMAGSPDQFRIFKQIYYAGKNKGPTGHPFDS